jgi:hypothetical protein
LVSSRHPKEAAIRQRPSSNRSGEIPAMKTEFQLRGQPGASSLARQVLNRQSRPYRKRLRKKCWEGVSNEKVFS